MVGIPVVTQSPKHLLPYFVVGSLLLSIVWGASYWAVTSEETQRYDQAELDAERAALRAAEYVTLTLQYADSYLKTAREFYHKDGLSAVTEHLENVPLLRSIVSHITIVDAQGMPLLVSGHEIKPGTTAKNRDYFKFHQSGLADTAYLSLPREGQNSGKVLTRLARRINSSDGTFEGVIFSAIDTTRFHDYFDALNLGPQGVAAVIGMDKKVRIYAGGSDEGHGYADDDLNFDDSMLWQEIVNNPVGLYEAIEPLDDVRRLSAYRRLTSYPLAVVAGISLEHISSGAVAYQSTVYLTAGAVSVLLVVLLVLMFRDTRTAQELDRAQSGLQDEVAARTADLSIEIDERRLVERALKDSEVRLRGFAEASSDWFWEMDEHCRFSYFSNRFTEVTGVPEEALLGKTREETGIPDVDPKLWKQQLEDLASHRSFRNFEHPREMPDGRTVHLSISGRAQFDEDGRFTGYLGTGSDVTQKKTAENMIRSANQELERRVEERTQELRQLNEQLREEDDKLREILENSPVGIAIVSHNADRSRLAGDRLFVNSAMVRMFGAADHESFRTSQIDKSWVDESDWNAVDKIFDAGKDLVNFEIPRRRMDGSTWWVSMNSRPIRFNDQDCNIVWHFDITERVEAEEQLRQAQKMEAVGQLTGGVAHDFNNLLAVVMGNADLLAPESDADASRIAAIIRAARRGSDLTQRLLAFSRKQTLRPQAVDLDALIGGMKEMLGRTLGETIDIQTSFESGLWQANVDPSQLENAILNLTINARDAMPRGGRLVIEANNASLDEAYTQNNPDVVPGKYVMVAVSDTGSGMTPDVVEHAFEPFFTTKEVGEGSGLGLSMIYGFLKQSEGHATIYSELGHGTTIRLYLPLVEGEAEQAQDETITDTPGATGETILVVEDDADVRELAVDVLRHLKYEVMEAPDAKTALSLLAKQSVSPHLMLSDVVLPGGLSGPDLAEKVKRDFPNMKVLFMSGYANRAAQSSNLTENGAQLIDKPFRIPELASKVREVLEG